MKSLIEKMEEQQTKALEQQKKQLEKANAAIDSMAGKQEGK